MPSAIEPGAERDQTAAARHRLAAERHEKAATFWAERGELKRVPLEGCAARLGARPAELECDYPAFAGGLES